MDKSKSWFRSFSASDKLPQQSMTTSNSKQNLNDAGTGPPPAQLGVNLASATALGGMFRRDASRNAISAHTKKQ